MTSAENLDLKLIMEFPTAQIVPYIVENCWTKLNILEIVLYYYAVAFPFLEMYQYWSQKFFKPKVKEGAVVFATKNSTLHVQ